MSPSCIAQIIFLVILFYFGKMLRSYFIFFSNQNTNIKFTRSDYNFDPNQYCNFPSQSLLLAIIILQFKHVFTVGTCIVGKKNCLSNFLWVLSFVLLVFGLVSIQRLVPWQWYLGIWDNWSDAAEQWMVSLKRYLGLPVLSG